LFGIYKLLVTINVPVTKSNSAIKINNIERTESTSTDARSIFVEM